MPKWRKLYVKATESLDIQDMPDDLTRLLWVMLPLGLDREGRGYDNPAWVKARAMPLREDVTNERIIKAMDWYEARGMLVRYRVNGRGYFYLSTFSQYQGKTDREAPSELPPPPLTTDSRPTQDLVTTSSCLDVDVDVDVEGDAVPPARFLDPVEHMLVARGTLKPGVSDPHQDKQAWIRYREEALNIFQRETGIHPNPAQRDEIVTVAGEDGFVVERWRTACHTCAAALKNAGNVPCIIDTYRAGGDYRKMLESRRDVGGNSSDPFAGQHKDYVPPPFDPAADWKDGL